MPVPIRVEKAGTANEVFHKLLDLTEPWKAGGPQVPTWLFRGHRDLTWELRASLHRELMEPKRFERLKEIRQTVVREAGLRPGPDNEKMGRLPEPARRSWRSQVIRQQVDWVRDFALLALRAGQLTGAAAAEASLALNLKGIHCPQIDVDSCPTLIGLAQHHKIPSEFLDWTWNPHVALYFAVESITQGQTKAPEGSPEATAEIWGVPEMWIPPRVRLMVMVDQSFAKAQDGVFTYDQAATWEFTEHGKIETLDNLLGLDVPVPSTADWDTMPHMKPFRLRFPHSIAEEIKLRLLVSGIGTPSLRPTLDNIAGRVLNPTSL